MAKFGAFKFGTGVKFGAYAESYSSDSATTSIYYEEDKASATYTEDASSTVIYHDE